MLELVLEVLLTLCKRVSLGLISIIVDIEGMVEKPFAGSLITFWGGRNELLFETVGSFKKGYLQENENR